MTTHDAQSYGEHLGLDIGYIYIYIFFLIFDSNILIRVSDQAMATHNVAVFVMANYINQCWTDFD